MGNLPKTLDKITTAAKYRDIPIQNFLQIYCVNFNSALNVQIKLYFKYFIDLFTRYNI